MAILETLLGKVVNQTSVGGGHNDHQHQQRFNDLTSTLVVSYLLILIAYLLMQWLHKQLKLPPGPWGLPVSGIIPFIKKEFHLLLFDYAKKYGGIVSFKMGMETIVVLSDHKIIRKAFKLPDMTARPKGGLVGVLLNGYGKCRHY